MGTVGPGFPLSSQETVYDVDEITLDETGHELVTAIKRNAVLESRLMDLDNHFVDADAQVDLLQGIVAEYKTMQVGLRLQVKTLQQKQCSNAWYLNQTTNKKSVSN
jgi:hypothetical protein